MGCRNNGLSEKWAVGIMTWPQKNTKAPREKSSRGRSANVVNWHYLLSAVPLAATATNCGYYKITILSSVSGDGVKVQLLHSGYFRYYSVHITLRSTTIVTDWDRGVQGRWTPEPVHGRGCLSSLNPRSKSVTDLHSSETVYKKYII